MKKQTAGITHQDIQKALAEFRKRGGLIRSLPDQVAVRSTSVSCGESFQTAAVASGEGASSAA
ncbi:MAG TPA: hypothetical protein VF678_04880 [bacterium]